MADYSDAYRSFGTSTTSTGYGLESKFGELEKRIKALEDLTASKPTAKIKGDLLKRIEELEAENTALRQTLLDLEDSIKGALK